MKIRWPWHASRKAEPENGRAAALAKEAAQRRLAGQVRRWPEVRDILAQAAEDAMRRRHGESR